MQYLDGSWVMTTDVSLDELLQKFSEAYLEAEGSMGRFNVLLIGKTGVGKSTLLNAVFREPLAKIGSGRPVTQDVRQYVKDDFPITAYDTPGLELSGEQIQRVQLDIAQLIEDKRLKPMSEHIHVIWYCISHEGQRIEAVEVEWLQKLDLKDIPVILVITKTLTRKHSEFLQALDAENLPVRQIVPILAEPVALDDEITIASHGLDQLVEVTFELLPEVARKAFVNGSRSISLKSRAAMSYLSGYIATAFAIGFTPIPFADAPILVTMQTTMLAHLTVLFGLPFDRGFISTVFSSIVGSGGMSLVGRSVVNNLLKLFPGAGLVVGGVISGSTAGALTLALGLAYISSLKYYMRAQMQGQQMSMQDLARIIRQEYQYYVRTGRQDLRGDDEPRPDDMLDQ